jgi:hypothetical protein
VCLKIVQRLLGDLPMRVNARLDPESQRQLEYLLEATGAGVSDVLKASISHYYAEVRSERAPRWTRLAPFIGTQSSGRSDVSVKAKELLTEGFGSKRMRPATEKPRGAK